MNIKSVGPFIVKGIRPKSYSMPYIMSIKWTTFDAELTIARIGQNPWKANLVLMLEHSLLGTKSIVLPTWFRIYERAKSKIRLLLTLLNPLPCYVHFWGRDCDYAEMQTVRRYWTHWQGMKAIKAFKYEWQEGPSSCSFISKEDYKQYLNEGY